MISPDWAAVRALKFFTKSMMLTPAWPRAGPTGGAGVAWPAGICSLIWLITFFAIAALSASIGLGPYRMGTDRAVVHAGGSRGSAAALPLPRHLQSMKQNRIPEPRHREGPKAPWRSSVAVGTAWR